MACLPLFFLFFDSVLSFCSCVCLLCLSSFLPCLLSCSLSCLLGFVAWLLALVGLLFLFPFRTIRKKKGRKGLSLASSLVLLWVALFGCCFVLCELVRTQSVNIVTKFYIKIFAAGAANFFALACVLTCVGVFPFHIYFFYLFPFRFICSVPP